MNLGNKLLELRKKKGFNQEEVAEKLNVTRQTVSNWECGQTSPDLNQAKEISKLYNISLDELVDNSLSSILVEKVSNTEKLAGLIITILKIFGICLVGFILFMIICFIVFNREREISEIKSVEMSCTINDKEYNIYLGNNDYYNCDNCDEQMNVYLKDITDWANMDHSIENINTYFNNNGGSCKEIK